MGKAGKTTTQIGMQAYGGMQTVLRRASREENDRYAQPGSEAHSRHIARVQEMEARREYRAKAIREFDRDEPRFGSYKGMTAEEATAAAVRRTEITLAWREKRNAFIKALDESHPAIKY